MVIVAPLIVSVATGTLGVPSRCVIATVAILLFAVPLMLDRPAPQPAHWMIENPVTVDPLWVSVTVIGMPAVPNVPVHVPVKGSADDGAVGELLPLPHESVSMSDADHSTAKTTRVTILMILQFFFLKSHFCGPLSRRHTCDPDTAHACFAGHSMMRNADTP